MNFSFLGFLPLILIFFLIIALKILIGVYVYKDTLKYGLDPLLWTLIAVLIPNLIGLIIYLVVRSGRRERYICPNCGKTVQKDFIKCPYCDTELSNKCPNCGKQLNADWETCPYCGAKADRGINYGTINYNAEGSGNRNKGLIAIIVIFIVLILAIISVFVLNLMPVKYNSNINMISEESSIPVKAENNEDENIIFSLKNTYGFWEGNSRKQIRINLDGDIKIYYNSVVDNGSLTISLLDSDGKLIDKLPANQEGTYEKEVKEGEVYYIDIDGDKTKGMYDIKITQD
ncbi:MAG: zinc ribbon domain-containing protein [Clostridiaceae bacterium]